MSETTHNGLLVHAATPLTVEDLGTIRLSGGVEWRKWKIRMDNDILGIYWGGKDQPPPFTVGAVAKFTVKVMDYGHKISPYNVSVERDKEDRIARMAALNTANALIANGGGETTVENLTGIADKLLEWINQQQPTTPNK